MRQPAPAGGTGLWPTCPPIRAFCRRVPAPTVALPEGAIQTRTDFGKAGYGGAAPPKGETHRYIFTVHALDVEKIEVDEGASGAMVGFNVHFHSLESASITAMYS